MKKLSNIYPGEVLLEEFMIPYKISAYRLAKSLEIPQTRVSQILKGQRKITVDTALRLSSFFGNSPQFWLGLQTDYDIEEMKNRYTEILKRIRETGTQNIDEFQTS